MSVAPEMNAVPTAQSKRILVIDDDPSIHVFLQKAINSFGTRLECDFVLSARDAELQLASRRDYHLIVADFLLEKPPNGWAIRDSCERIAPDCRFTMMSSMPLEEPGQCDLDFLKKPFSLDECRAFLARQLEIEIPPTVAMRGPRELR